MSTKEFSASSAEIAAQANFNPDSTTVLRNNRLLCWVTMSGSFFAVIMAACMALMVVSLVFLSGALNFSLALSALQWALAAVAMGYMSRWLWKLGRAMQGYQILLDVRGVTFNLGTPKARADLFLAWNQIAAIKSKRNINVQSYLIEGTDGSRVSFSSYTFFRPKKVARLIAGRAGLEIQKC